MSAAVVRAWGLGSGIVGRRLSARYPLSLGILTLAMIVAACASSQSPDRALTLERVPFRHVPAELTGVKIPIEASGVAEITARLPDRLAGLEFMPHSGWQGSDRFVAAWGPPNGQAGVPPLQIVIVNVTTLGGPAAASGAQAVLADANRNVNIAGRLEVGRDGRLIWLHRQDAGSTVAWGRLDSPWLYVVTAATERDAMTILRTFSGAAGTHGGSHSTLR
jgi:hypothetical protein